MQRYVAAGRAYVCECGCECVWLGLSPSYLNKYVCVYMCIINIGALRNAAVRCCGTCVSVCVRVWVAQAVFLSTLYLHEYACIRTYTTNMGAPQNAAMRFECVCVCVCVYVCVCACA